MTHDRETLIAEFHQHLEETSTSVFYEGYTISRIKMADVPYGEVGRISFRPFGVDNENLDKYQLKFDTTFESEKPANLFDNVQMITKQMNDNYGYRFIFDEETMGWSRDNERTIYQLNGVFMKPDGIWLTY